MLERPTQRKTSIEGDQSLEILAEPNIKEERFDKIAKWSKIGGLVGLVTYIGAVAVDSYESSEKDFQYRHYIESVDETEKGEYDRIKDKIQQELGNRVIEKIETGDRLAFGRRELPIKTPDFIGFHSNDTVLDGMPEYFFTEQFNLYPKNWLNGQIDKVEVKPMPRENVTADGNVRGGIFTEDQFNGASTTIIYDIRTQQAINSDVYLGDLSDYFKETFAHEAGHANDWESRSDLSLTERAQMLELVLNRVNSTDAYSDKSLNDGLDYWRSYDDGTESGKERAVSEYWAVICAAYFVDPSKLKSESPSDFALVEKYIKRSDPNFDIFDKERGAYNQFTGEVRDKWKDDVLALKSKAEN